MPHPMRGKFPHVPCVHGEHFLYAAELTRGMVKVGQTQAPRQRLIGLAYEAKRDFGAAILQFQIFKVPGRLAATDAEQRALALLASAGTADPIRREYFAGVVFSEAVRIAEQAARGLSLSALASGQGAGRRSLHVRTVSADLPVVSHNITGAP